jgi:hypothetical protein
MSGRKSWGSAPENSRRVWPPGDMKDWDGLLGRFIEQANADRAVLADHYLREWFTASRPGVGQL